MSEIKHGDCLEVLKGMDAESVDLVCTDPPYGYSFMGKDWDKAVPSVEVWQQCLRVLKPGGFAFVMSAPRQDVLSRMIVNLEEAGFRTDFTSIYWTYASGFPKAGNIGKMVDKKMGADREVIGRVPMTFGVGGGSERHGGEKLITKPATPEAEALDGSYGGYQPKPAVEIIIVAMKPLTKGTFVGQAMDNGKGVTWLDQVRVPSDELPDKWSGASHSDIFPINKDGVNDGYTGGPHEGGRFPANLVVGDNALGDHSKHFDIDAWWEERLKELPDSAKKTFPYLVVTKPNEQDKGKDNIHPTVKPVKLMSYLVALGSKPGDTVLDPYVGSGTTAVAAHKSNRVGVGIEREDEYAKIAQDRLDNITPTLL